jgi:multiple sugar transport system ATP-binding protein
MHGQKFKIFTLDRSALTPPPNIRVDFPEQHLHLFDEKGVRLGES